ncbi:MAG: hypothetical protein IPK10_19185 [Bacteroidetes bacterium]|nr:hypothetical protein [Bacteroidota bacterium]
MKKSLHVIVIIICCFAVASTLKAQTYPPVAQIYGSSPFQDSLWVLDAEHPDFL